MKCIGAVLCVFLATAHAQEVQVELKNWELIAAGAAVGFVSDNSTDLMSCGFGLLSEAADVNCALKDFEEAWETKNLSYVADAVARVAKAIKGMPAAKDECKVPVDDVKSIVAEIRKYHGLKSIIVHVLHNMIYDREKIFAELSSAAHDYKAGSFLTVGQQLGMAVRRMLVGEAAPNSPNVTQNPLLQFNLREVEVILGGAAVGFVSDTGDLKACGLDALPVLGDLKFTVVDLIEGLITRNWTDVKAALNKAADAIRAVTKAKAGCKVSIVDVESIVAEIKKYKGLQLILHVFHDVVHDGKTIFGELSKSFHAYESGAYLNAGVQLGEALRRMLVGEAAPADPVIHV